MATKAPKRVKVYKAKTAAAGAGAGNAFPIGLSGVKEVEPKAVKAHTKPKAPADPDELETLNHAAQVVGKDQLASWINSPVPALGGKTPYSLLQTAEGRNAVNRVLGQIEHGVY